MNSKFIALCLVMLIVLSAGCVVKLRDIDNMNTSTCTSCKDDEISDSQSEQEETEETIETDEIECGSYWLEYKEHLASGFSEAAAAALTHECVKTYSPTGDEVKSDGSSSSGSSSSNAPATDGRSTVIAYMTDNSIATFEGLAGRIFTVKTTSTSGSLTYSVSTNDPGQESVYLCGVLFINFPSIEEVNVTGYNNENKEIEASVKYFKRVKYNFNNYKLWFPNYVYTDCDEDSDCADDNSCTRDFCKDNKCNNIKIVGNTCPG